MWTCPSHLKNVTVLPCEMQNSFAWWEVYCFPSKRWWLWKGELCCVRLAAVKRAGCVVWQLECQASNVTASVQSDSAWIHAFSLYRHWLITSSTTLCWHSAHVSTSRCHSRAYRGLELGRHASTSCPRCNNQPWVCHECWLATCHDW